MLLAFYEKAIEGLFAANEEAWKQDHEGAIQCLEFEKVVQQTNALYDRVIEEFDTWYDGAIQSDREEDRSTFDRWRALFQEMEKYHLKLISRLNQYESSDYTVNGAERLRKGLTELEQYRLPHPDFFAGEEFENYAREAVEAHKLGEFFQ